MPVRRPYILWAYRRLLGHEPESDRVVDLRAALRSPQPSDMEMHCFPQPELFALIAQAGARLIEVREDDTPKCPEFDISNSFVLTKPALGQRTARWQVCSELK